MRDYSYAFLLSLFFIGCSSETAVAPSAPAVELKAKTEKHGEVAETSEAGLVRSAKRLYESGVYSVAVDYLETLRDSYPLGAYGEFAEVKTADSKLLGNDYAQAATLFEEFIRNHPGSPSTDYALFGAARSYQLLYRGVGRDIAPLEKSKDFYQKLAEGFPDSPYAAAALPYQEEVLRMLAEYDANIIEFYKRRGLPHSAEARATQYEAHWPKLLAASHEQSARVESQSVGAAAPYAPVITATSPVRMKPRSATRVAQAAANEGSDGSRLLSIECDPKTQSVFIYWDALGSQVQALDGKRIAAADGAVHLTLPVSGAAQTRDCFASTDLSLTADGTLTVRGVGDATAIVLPNPSRLLLTFNS